MTFHQNYTIIFKGGEKSTEELLKTLKENSLETYLSNNTGELVDSPIYKYLEKIIEDKVLKKSDIIKKSGVQTNYAYQIFSGLKIPSRDKLIALCFGMELSLDEAQTLLKYAGYAKLYPRTKRDSIIIDALEKHINIINCNITLDKFNLSPL